MSSKDIKLERKWLRVSVGITVAGLTITAIAFVIGDYTSNEIISTWGSIMMATGLVGAIVSLGSVYGALSWKVRCQLLGLMMINLFIAYLGHFVQWWY